MPSLQFCYPSTVRPLPATATAKVTRVRLLSFAVLVWLGLAAPIVSFATSFLDLSPPCCHAHNVGGLAGLFSKHSCCCRRAASHSSSPAIHSRSECGSACGHVPNSVPSSVNLTVGRFSSSLAPTASTEALPPLSWSAPAAQILALRRYQRPPPSFPDSQ